MDTKELNFLQIIGLLTVLILLPIFMYYIGWYLLLVFLWLGSIGICFYTDHTFVNSKKIQDFLLCLFISFFSGLFFWMIFSDLFDFILKNLSRTIISYMIFINVIFITGLNFFTKDQKKWINKYFD